MTEILLTTLCTSQLYPLLPHLQGRVGKRLFTFQSLGISPALWGQTDDNNPGYPALSSRVKFPNVIIPALREQSKSNYPAPQPTYSMATLVGWGPWIQMTGALNLNQ